MFIDSCQVIISNISMKGYQIIDHGFVVPWLTDGPLHGEVLAHLSRFIQHR